jgi:peptide/nickel transport system substrate-binding protein
MRNYRWSLLFMLPALLAPLPGCRHQLQDKDAVTMLIESSPANLDPRIGTDGQSEHIDSLIFDALVRKDEKFNVYPWLARSWETPDPRTYIFHLNAGVRFHDGRGLSSADVKWTIDTIRNGQIPTVKSGAFRQVDRVDAPEPLTVVVHLKGPDPALLWSLSDGAFGVVPAGSGSNFGQHPIGTGPFRFVSQEQDQQVILERNLNSWQSPPAIQRIRFAVVPDAITRALELQKGSADVCINALTADMIYALRDNPVVQIDTGPGTVLNYVTFNVRDPILRDSRVRQAIAYAINRRLIIHALWRDRARIAESLLPPEHWAWTGEVAHHDYDPREANALLDAAGWKRNANGIRFHVALKTSTDETSRMLAQVLQQQLRTVGIELDVRSFEFATFYSDISKGVFQMYTLRWIGGNEDPDIFRYAYQTASFPPKGANRGHYSNPALDRMISEAIATPDNAARRSDYVAIQRMVAEDLPSINLWYLDTVLVHNRRLGNLHLSSSGNYDFLRDAILLK